MEVINFFSEDVSEPEFDQSMVRDWIQQVVKLHTFTCDPINFIFCSDAYLLDMNKKYLNHDYYTDVITFDYSDNKRISGDVFISMDMVRYNAKKYDRALLNELLRVVIHGVLHLCGFNDKTDAEQEMMTQQEDLALSLLKS